MHGPIIPVCKVREHSLLLLNRTSNYIYKLLIFSFKGYRMLHIVLNTPIYTYTHTQTISVYIYITTITIIELSL